MEEKNTTALLEKPQTVTYEKKTEKKVVNLSKLRQQQKEKQEKQEKSQQINFFAAKIDEKPNQEVVNLASVVEKPNYDFMETLPEAKQEKIFKIKKEGAQKASSPLLKKIKIITFVLLFAVFGSWTIYNAAQLSNVTTQYDLKLGNYLAKLGTLDSASNTNDLFPTYSEEGNGASSIEKQSNWFDRFCNFIGGIFGG